MDYAEYVNPLDIIGGLEVSWNKEVNLTILGNEKNFIGCKISIGRSGSVFFITWVDGDPDL